MEVTIGQLLSGRIGLSLDGMPTHVVLHRALPASAYRATGLYRHPDDLGPAHYYLRVLQGKWSDGLEQSHLAGLISSTCRTGSTVVHRCVLFLA